MESWGFVNGKLEPWDFGTLTVGGNAVQRVGWLNEEASVQLVAPVKDNLVFEVLAWTPSTKGTITASVVHITTPQGPEVPPAPGAAPGGAGSRRRARHAAAARSDRGRADGLLQADGVEGEGRRGVRR